MSIKSLLILGHIPVDDQIFKMIISTNSYYNPHHNINNIYIIAEGEMYSYTQQFNGIQFNIEPEVDTTEGLLMKMIDGLRGALLVKTNRNRLVQICRIIFNNAHTHILIDHRFRDILIKIDTLLQILEISSVRDNLDIYPTNKMTKISGFTINGKTINYFAEIFTYFLEICNEITNRLDVGNPRKVIMQEFSDLYSVLIHKITDYIGVSDANTELFSDPDQSYLYMLTLKLRDTYVAERATQHIINNNQVVIIMGEFHKDGIKEAIPNIIPIGISGGGKYKQKYLKYKKKYIEYKQNKLVN